MALLYVAPRLTPQKLWMVLVYAVWNVLCRFIVTTSSVDTEKEMHAFFHHLKEKFPYKWSFTHICCFRPVWPHLWSTNVSSPFTFNARKIAAWNILLNISFWRSYRFGLTWRWINGDRISIFGINICSK